ncbi:MAG: hypothetical protein ABJH98_06985 [Reichenbachiella sp.]|uniref:hypothetical protein n=1 Tax=Reichenbachiella sp. TaxID=2184521 RepID=UPI0032997440
MKKAGLILALFVCLIGWQVSASLPDSIQHTTHKSLRFSDMKFFAAGQFWFRHTKLNPGSQVDGIDETSITDLSIRRFRMGLNGDVTERLFVKIQVGLNNMNYLTRISGISLLDLLVVYKLDKRLHLGLGKNGYTGPSRYASAASTSALGVDIPIFALSTINIEDDYLRKFSVFAKGNLGQLNYRLVLAKPSKPLLARTIEEEANFSYGDPKMQVSSYFKYQFLEKETMQTAFMPGTYYGTKKVLNLGFGFLTQDQATWSLVENDTSYHRMKQWALDLFADLPMNASNTQSLTLYAAFFHTDFGPSYLRMIGVNNPTLQSDGSTLNGSGNRYPSIGTGKVYYGQLGYRFMLPGELKRIGAVQPYLNIQYADYDRLQEKMLLYELGGSLIFDGHRSKLTFGWQNRPIYNNGDHPTVTERKSMYVLQYQFKL